MLILTADDVRTTLPTREAIEAMKQAYAALSDGRLEIPRAASKRRASPPRGASNRLGKWRWWAKI